MTREEDIQDRLTYDLLKFLHKLGIKSAGPTSGVLTERQLRDMMIAAQGNFGMPDKLIMSEDAFAALSKHFK